MKKRNGTDTFASSPSFTFGEVRKGRWGRLLFVLFCTSSQEKALMNFEAKTRKKNKTHCGRKRKRGENGRKGKEEEPFYARACSLLVGGGGSCMGRISSVSMS